MPSSPASDRDRRAQQAAYLRAQHNYSQEEIGRILGGVSQSHVSRLLAHAAECGWLVTEMRFDDSSISPEVMRERPRLRQRQRLTDGRRLGAATPAVRTPRRRAARGAAASQQHGRRHLGPHGEVA